MKKLLSFLMLACVAFMAAEVYAYEPYYVKQETLKRYISILKKEQDKVNDKYQVYYVCKPDLNAGLDKVPSLFVITVDHNNRTMQATAYVLIWNDNEGCPEMTKTEIPMDYENFKLRSSHNKFVILQQTDTGWNWTRFNSPNDYQKLGKYEEDPYRNMVTLQPSSPDDLQPLRAAFSN